MSLPLYPVHSDLTANLSQNTTSEPTGVGVQRSILAPVLFLEMAVGVFGNILVIVTKIKNSKLVRSNFGILMFNLSVSDLGCSLVIMVSALVSVLAGSWVLGAVVCDLVCLLNYTFIIVSMGTLGAISLDRFVAVVFAVRYRTLFPRGVAVLACVSTWISGLVFGSVPVILRWVSYDGSELVCTIRWNEDFCRVVIYTLCAFAVCFLTPIVIIASSYSLMYRAYRRAASKSNRKNSSSPRLAEMIIVLVLSYLFCYSPFAVTKVLKVAKQDLRAVPDWLSMLASLMAFLNCGMNPLIYLTNPGFREAVLKMCWTNGRREIHSVCKTVSKEQRPA